MTGGGVTAIYFGRIMSWLWVLVLTLKSGAGEFTIDPQSQTVTEGSTLTLICSFNHGCNDDIYFYVKKSHDGIFNVIRVSERLKRNDDTSKCVLEIFPVTKEDEGEYYCYLTAYYFTGTSFTAHVTVYVPDAPSCYIVKNTSKNTVDLICNSTVVSDKLSWLTVDSSSLSSRTAYSFQSPHDVYNKTFTCITNHGTRKCSVQPRPIELKIRSDQTTLEVGKSASYECIANASPTITSYVWTFQNENINERDSSKNIHVNENGTVLHFKKWKTKFLRNNITCTVSNAIDKETVSEQMIFDILESTPSIPITEGVGLQDSSETPTYSISTIKATTQTPVRQGSTVQRTTLTSDQSIQITEKVGHASNETPTYSSTIETNDEDTVDGRPNTNNNSSYYYIAIGSVCVIAIGSVCVAVIIVLLCRKSRSVRERSTSNKGTKSLGEYERDTGYGTEEGQAVNSVDLYHLIEGSSSKEDVSPNIEGMYATPDKTKINGGRHIGIATGEPIQTKNDVDNNGGESHGNQIQGNDKTSARKVDETPTNDSDSLYAKPNKPKHQPNDLKDTTEWVENDIYSMGEQPREEGVVRLNASLAEYLYARPNKERSEKNV